MKTAEERAAFDKAMQELVDEQPTDLHKAFAEGYEGKAKIPTILATLPDNSDALEAMMTTQDAEGWTPLHWPLASEDVVPLKQMLNKFEDGSPRLMRAFIKQDEMGMTPLCLALFYKRREMAKLILDKLDPTQLDRLARIPDNNDHTPLYHAAQSGFAELENRLRKVHNKYRITAEDRQKYKNSFEAFMNGETTLAEMERTASSTVTPSRWADIPTFDEQLYRVVFDANNRRSLEKPQTAAIHGELFKTLVTTGVLPQGREDEPPVRITDFGSNDGQTLIRYAKAAQFPGKLDVIAIDFNADAINSAKKNLLIEKSTSASRISKAGVVKANVYDVQLTKTLRDRQADISLISHVTYNVSHAEIATLLATADSQMKDSGVIISYHIKHKPNEYVDLTNRFGQRADVAHSTGAAEVADPTEAIRNAAIERGMQVAETEYTTKVLLHKMSDREWEAIKNPANFSLLPKHVQENAQVLTFIAHRSPNEMVADNSERSWEHYIDTVRAIAERNPANEKGDHSILATIAIQVISSSRATAVDKSRQQEAVTSLTPRVSDIAAQAERVFYRNQSISR